MKSFNQSIIVKKYYLMRTSLVNCTAMPKAKTRHYHTLLLTWLANFCLATLSFANPTLTPATFDTWRAAFKQEAALAGIHADTINATLEHVTLLPQVIKLDRAQPEFVTPYLDYYSKRVDALKIKQGRALLKKHETLLNRLEKQYGVPKAVLVAFWGLETHYGQFKGNVDTFSTLATLAYEGRRAMFFSQQLLDAMRIAEQQHVQIGTLKGSWAGAFGHMQFMPSTFQGYAIDGNHDGLIDLNHSIEDAFASAANYLSKIGWNKALPIAVEVTLPSHFLWQTAQLNNKKTIPAWHSLGLKSSAVLQSIGKQFPTVTSAIVLPQGAHGPAYMVFDNFDVVMTWNRSIFYALTVSELSNRLQSDKTPALKVAINQTTKNKFEKTLSQPKALSFVEMQLLQTLLNEHGFNAGLADGFPGVQTQAAIRAYQLTQQLPADGYASYDLLQRISSEPR
jgi:membrane-bound lytic murein transglycosylase B